MLLDISTNPSDHVDESAGTPEYRGVTRVLYNARVMRDFEVAESILERGSEVHRHTHLLDTVKYFNWNSVDKQYRGWVRAWGKFKADADVHILHSEHFVQNKIYGVRGRLDTICTFADDPRICVLEKKTGKLPPVTPLQLAAYGWLYDPKPPLQRVAVELREDGTYSTKVYPLREYLRDVHDFLALARTMHVQQRLGL